MLVCLKKNLEATRSAAFPIPRLIASHQCGPVHCFCLVGSTVHHSDNTCVPGRVQQKHSVCWCPHLKINGSHLDSCPFNSIGHRLELRASAAFAFSLRRWTKVPINGSAVCVEPHCGYCKKQRGRTVAWSRQKCN